MGNVVKNEMQDVTEAMKNLQATFGAKKETSGSEV